jgi:hypothetical protein
MAMKNWLLVGTLMMSCFVNTDAFAQEEVKQHRAFKITPWIITGQANTFRSCTGACSASPVFDLNVYWSSNQPWFGQTDTSFEVRPMLGLALTSYSAKLNGVGVDVEGQSAKLGAEFRYKQIPDLAFVVHGDLFGMTRVTGDNLPRQLDFASDGDIGFTFDFSPQAHVYVGYSFRSIPQPINNVTTGGVGLGFSWAPLP